MLTYIDTVIVISCVIVYEVDMIETVEIVMINDDDDDGYYY